MTFPSLLPVPHARQHPEAAVGTIVTGMRANDRVTRQLVLLRVSAHDVKVSAVKEGLVPEVVRGRLGADLLDAYAAAHR